MALRHEHSKVRPQPPRLKDVTKVTAPKRNRSHGADGRFQRGNNAATGRGWKSIIRRGLGREATGAEVEQAAREALAMFKARLRSLPSSDDPQVQDAAARAARSSVLSARLALRAVDLGLETPEGQKLIELSMRMDQRAERNDVTARDLAEKVSKARNDHTGRDPYAHLRGGNR